MKRRDLQLWSLTLVPENVHRRALIDQVVATALPESQDPEDVSLTVKAFMAAELHSELIELLEKLVLEQSVFSDNRNLQNLLLLTAIKSDKGKVMDFINRLTNFDAPEIASIAVQGELYEEAFVIYKRIEDHANAVTVLLDNLKSIDRAYEFAERLDKPEVWSRLAKAQLDSTLVKDAIDSYIRADDASQYVHVIHTAGSQDQYEDLVRCAV